MFAPNIHSVEVYGNILCLECRNCLRRAAVGAMRLRSARDTVTESAATDMSGIDHLLFRCSVCSSPDVAWLIPLGKEETERFVAGGPIVTSLASDPPPRGCDQD